MFALAPTAFGQYIPYRVDHWTTDNGLPQNTVRSILQTRDGYLWLGTFGGLARFDGSKFKVFDVSNLPQLPSSRVLSLFEDRDGALWIGTRNGLASWKGGKLTRYTELAGQSVSTLLEDMEGTVWAGGQRRLPPGNSARFTVARFSAMEKTAVLDGTSNQCTRIARGIDGWEPAADCGDGSRFLRNYIRCPTGCSRCWKSTTAHS